MSSHEENWAHRLEEQEPEENQDLGSGQPSIVVAEDDDEETLSLYFSCSSSSSSSTYFSAVSVQDWVEEGAEAMAPFDIQPPYPWPRRPQDNHSSNQGAGSRDGDELAHCCHKLDSKSSVDQEHRRMAMWQVLGETSCKTGSRLEQVERSCNQEGEGEEQEEEEAEEGEEGEGEEREQDEGEEEEEGINEGEEAEVEGERKEEERVEEESQGKGKEGDGAGSEDSSLLSKKPQEKMVD